MAPWLALVGLGAFHGINPAMGWLFAVALGMHRGSRRAVLMALGPIAVGHAASDGLVALAVLSLGFVIDPPWLNRVAGALLLGWAAWLALRGHRHRVRIGMKAGAAGLVLWSFLMATGHGAGLMLVPAIMPLYHASGHAHVLADAGSLPLAFAGVGVHMAATLAVTAASALLVYEWIGLGFLGRGWINLDRIWIAALVVAGIILLV